jgi:hypothetical protein
MSEERIVSFSLSGNNNVTNYVGIRWIYAG